MLTMIVSVVLVSPQTGCGFETDVSHARSGAPADADTATVSTGSGETSNGDARSTTSDAAAIQPGTYIVANADALTRIMVSRHGNWVSVDAIAAYHAFLKSVRMTLRDDGTLSVDAVDQGVTMSQAGKWQQHDDTLMLHITHENGRRLPAPRIGDADVVDGAIAMTMFGPAGDVIIVARQ